MGRSTRLPPLSDGVSHAHIQRRLLPADSHHRSLCQQCTGFLHRAEGGYLRNGQLTGLHGSALGDGPPAAGALLLLGAIQLDHGPLAGKRHEGGYPQFRALAYHRIHLVTLGKALNEHDQWTRRRILPATDAHGQAVCRIFDPTFEVISGTIDHSDVLTGSNAQHANVLGVFRGQAQGEDGIRLLGQDLLFQEQLMKGHDRS